MNIAIRQKYELFVIFPIASYSFSLWSRAKAAFRYECGR